MAGQGGPTQQLTRLRAPIHLQPIKAINLNAFKDTHNQNINIIQN